MPTDQRVGTEVGSSPSSLAEIAAQLSERAAQYARLETRLAAERLVKTALNRRLRLVITGEGQPVSLQIDPTLIKGPEQRELGDVIAKLIMAARLQTNTRRKNLEAELHEPPAGDLGGQAQ
jgi:DNA-binding protein YbaB